MLLSSLRLFVIGFPSLSKNNPILLKCLGTTVNRICIILPQVQHVRKWISINSGHKKQKREEILKKKSVIGDDRLPRHCAPSRSLKDYRKYESMLHRFLRLRSSHVCRSRRHCRVIQKSLHHTGQPRDEIPIWDYAGYGPEKWKRLYPACAGPIQSPISLRREDAALQTLSDEQYLSFKHYDLIYDGEFINNGVSLVMSLREADGGILPTLLLVDIISGFFAKFKMVQFHFHWPSEHVLDGIRYDLEMHMVHQEIDTKQFAVLSVLYRIDRDKAAAEVPRKFTQKGTCIFKQMDKVVRVGNRREVTCFIPESVMPIEYRKNWFVYLGSLTTPPCSPGVLWFVHRYPVTIYNHNMETLLKVFDKNGCRMIGNFRPLQSSKERCIVLLE